MNQIFNLPLLFSVNAKYEYCNFKIIQEEDIGSLLTTITFPLLKIT